MTEKLLTDILDWFKRISAPTPFRKHSRCPVCLATWFNVERHEITCWVPDLKKLVVND